MLFIYKYYLLKRNNVVLLK